MDKMLSFFLPRVRSQRPWSGACRPKGHTVCEPSRVPCTQSCGLPSAGPMEMGPKQRGSTKKDLAGYAPVSAFRKHGDKTAHTGALVRFGGDRSCNASGSL